MVALAAAIWYFTLGGATLCHRFLILSQPSTFDANCETTHHSGKSCSGVTCDSDFFSAISFGANRGPVRLLLIFIRAPSASG